MLVCVGLESHEDLGVCKITLKMKIRGIFTFQIIDMSRNSEDGRNFYFSPEVPRSFCSCAYKVLKGLKRRTVLELSLKNYHKTAGR